jgi:hypothetical protein
MKVEKWRLAVLLVPSLAAAQLPSATPDDKDAGAALAQLIHQAVTAKLPKVYEDDSGWGHTIPLPDRLRRPRLRRTIIEVDGRPEMPDGLWRKVRLRLEDPRRDLRIRVRSLQRVDATTYRLIVDSGATVRADADLQRWRNGVLMADVTAQTRLLLDVVVDCAITARLEAGRVPPRLRLEPDVKDLKIILKDFRAERVTFLRAGLTVEGEALEGLNEEFKDSLQGLLQSKQPEIKKRATEALAREFSKDKGPIPLAALLDAAAPLLKAAERREDK